METEIGTDIYRAASLLQAGQLVAIPTETVYGLAANALHPEGVSEIFAVKNRPSFNPLIVHGHHVDKIRPYISEWPSQAQQLASVFWPGPLTLLLPRNELIPDLVTAGRPKVAVRVPHHPLTLSLLSQLDFPLAAPSANPFNYISPTTAQHVYQQLNGRIPYILDGGPTEVGLESTIVGWEDGKPHLFRLGGLGLEELEAEIGPLTMANQASRTPQSSGMLKKHYAPRTKLIFAPENQWPFQVRGRIATITFEEFPTYPAHTHYLLSPCGSLSEAAQRLFALLRQVDSGAYDLILAAPVPEEGLGLAINDRLQRASTD